MTHNWKIIKQNFFLFPKQIKMSRQINDIRDKIKFNRGTKHL